MYFVILLIVLLLYHKISKFSSKFTVAKKFTDIIIDAQSRFGENYGFDEDYEYDCTIIFNILIKF